MDADIASRKKWQVHATAPAATDPHAFVMPFGFRLLLMLLRLPLANDLFTR